MKYMHLICSNCSNPATPEFRPFVLDDVERTLTCENCNRTLRYLKPEKAKENWCIRLLKRNTTLVDPTDYVLEVEYEGDR